MKTVIGYGSPNKSGKADAHGAPLGEDELALTKEYYKWTFDQDFHVPEEVYDRFKEASEELGVKQEQQWNELFDQYENEHKELATQLKKQLPMNFPLT